MWLIGERMNNKFLNLSVMLMSLYTLNGYCESWELKLDHTTAVSVSENDTLQMQSKVRELISSQHAALDNLYATSTNKHSFAVVKTETLISVSLAPFFKSNYSAKSSVSKWVNSFGLNHSYSNAQVDLYDEIKIPHLIGPINYKSDGLKLAYQISQPIGYNWELTSSGDIGGYGFKDTLSGSVKLGVTYKLTPRWDVSALYKGSYLELDSRNTVENHNFDYEALTHGPVISASFQF